jgi:DNA-binding helix-hairpin-helix protein with protein kinase domain
MGAAAAYQGHAKECPRCTRDQPGPQCAVGTRLRESADRLQDAYLNTKGPK